MYDRLSQIEIDIEFQLRKLDWEAQKEGFQSDISYDQEKGQIILVINGKTISYSLGEYLFDYPREDVLGEAEEGAGSLSLIFHSYFDLIQRLIDRAVSIHDRLEQDRKSVV